MKSQTVAAVIVTYNRLELLKKCIESVRNQTRKLDNIIVINNSSTDGTEEWLFNESDLLVITQPNSGGAGGFYTGIKTAYEMGYDWIWCMDDDCYMHSECLENLFNYYKVNTRIEVLSPLIKISDSDSLSFLTPIIIKNKYINSTFSFNELKKYKQDIYEGYAAFFNGALINKNIVQLVGFPKKEMFIWGDELEYFHRIKSAGCKITTIFKALCYHPKSKWHPGPKILNKFVYASSLDWRAYCFFRNLGFLSKSYYRFYNIRFVAAQVIYYLFYKNFSFTSVIFFIKAYSDGLRGIFKTVTH